MRIESNHDVIGKILDDDSQTVICEELNMQYSITNYAILCDDKLLCFTGSDIIDASNIEYMLSQKYPEHEFSISDEFMKIT